MMRRSSLGLLLLALCLAAFFSSAEATKFKKHGFLHKKKVVPTGASPPPVVPTGAPPPPSPKKRFGHPNLDLDLQGIRERLNNIDFNPFDNRP